MPKIVTELPFAPEARLTWFHRAIRWLSHHPDIPSSHLPQDPIFNFIGHLPCDLRLKLNGRTAD